MPLLEGEKLEKLFLPSSDELPDDQKEWVVMDVSGLKGADLDAIEDDSGNVMRFFGQIVSQRIREWNVTDTDGSLAEITKENLGRLPLEDRAFLFGQIDQAGGQALPKEPTGSSSAI